MNCVFNNFVLTNTLVYIWINIMLCFQRLQQFERKGKSSCETVHRWKQLHTNFTTIRRQICCRGKLTPSCLWVGMPLVLQFTSYLFSFFLWFKGTNLENDKAAACKFIPHILNTPFIIVWLPLVYRLTLRDLKWWCKIS